MRSRCSVRLHRDARLANHDVLQNFIDVGLGQVFHAACANERDDVTVDSADVAGDGARLLRPSTLPEDEARVQVVEIEGTELLDGDRWRSSAGLSP